MEIKKDRCKKVSYDSLDNAVRDLELGREFFTNRSCEILVKIDSPELIKRYFHRLYTYK